MINVQLDRALKLLSRLSVFEIGMKFTILQLKLLGPSIYLAVGCEASGSEAKQFYHHQSDNLGNGGPRATTNLGSSILLKQDICVVCGMWYYGVVKVIFFEQLLCFDINESF